MRITIVGSGYVGLVSGICFAEFGFNVTGVDIDETKISRLQKGILPIYEPGLEELLQSNLRENRISFTTDLVGTLPNADLIFLAIGTPSAADGTVDLSYISEAIRTIAPHLQKYTPIVIKSTVPPGTCRTLKQEILLINPTAKFDIISNPEFLREGVAVRDFMQPDRVVVGLDNPLNQDIMEKLYRPLHLQRIPIIFTTLETAELIKYASNALLATKIGFINEMADICEKIGADVQMVAYGVGTDKRIGPQFLQVGPGYGGSCFPKDTLGLQSLGRQINARSKIVDAVISSNNDRIRTCIEKIYHACNGSLTNKEIAVLGVAFKANTDDIRESPAVKIIEGLLSSGARLRLFDPAALENAQNHFGFSDNIFYAKDLSECVRGAHVAIVLTEWPEFKSLNMATFEQLLCKYDQTSSKTLIDFRNLYSLDDFADTKLKYVSVGRPVFEPQSIKNTVDV